MGIAILWRHTRFELRSSVEVDLGDPRLQEEGVGLRVWGLGLRVWGLGFRAEGFRGLGVSG